MYKIPELKAREGNSESLFVRARNSYGDFRLGEASKEMLSHIPKKNIISHNINSTSALVILPSEAPMMLFQNIWHNPQLFFFESNSQIKKHLLGIQKKWFCFETSEAHQSKLLGKIRLIQDTLGKNKNKTIDYVSPPFSAPIGRWTLLSHNTCLLSSACSCWAPHSAYDFREDKENPPSRAYLKLWEIFYRLQILPRPNSISLDLGAAPGSWSWVLSKFCKKIIAIDRSHLAENISSLNNIESRTGNILNFETLPQDITFDFICCDAALHPDKLFPIIQKLTQKHPQASFIVTLKLKGTELPASLYKYEQIPGSKIIGLCQGKHECYWVKIHPQTSVSTKIHAD